MLRILIIIYFSVFTAEAKELLKKMENCPFKLTLLKTLSERNGNQRPWLEVRIKNISAKDQTFQYHHYRNGSELEIYDESGKKIPSYENVLSVKTVDIGLLPKKNEFKTLKPGEETSLDSATDMGFRTNGSLDIFWSPYRYLLPPGKYRIHVSGPELSHTKWHDQKSGKHGELKESWLGHLKSSEMEYLIPAGQKPIKDDH